jgi:hypothetical protein
MAQPCPNPGSSCVVEGESNRKGWSRDSEQRIKNGTGFIDELTVFKSLGLAVEDLAAAERILRRAEAEDAGVEVEL